MKNTIRTQIRQTLNRLAQLAGLEPLTREIKKADSWDGAASNYPDTDAYCSACLIDVNLEGEDKVQGLCMLPIRGPDDEAGVMIDKAVIAAVGGRGITQVEKPEGVEQETWDEAIKNAANQLITAYEQMDRVAPEAVYKLAGKEMPEGETETPSEDDGEMVEESRAIAAGNLIGQVYAALNQMAAEYGNEDGYWDFWINDLYFDESGSPFVVISSNGKLYRAALTVADNLVTVGALQEVVIDFPPAPAGQPEEVRAMTTVTRQADGRYRWFGISCSSVLNRIGVFDTRDLFDSFAEYFRANPKKEVIRQFYHQGAGYRTGVVDYVERDGNLLITSGLYDDTPLAKAEIAARLQDGDYWGDSIGYLGEQPEMIRAADGIEIPAYRKGILREVSTLPEVDAASHFTVQSVTTEEVTRMLQGKALEAFIKLWGGDEDKAKEWLEAHPDKMNRAIEDMGLQTRQAATPAPEPTATADPVAEAIGDPPSPAQPVPQAELTQAVEFVMGDAEVAEIARAVGETEGFVQLRNAVDTLQTHINELTAGLAVLPTLGQQLASIETRLKALEQDEEQKRAAWVADLPQARKVAVTYRPSTHATDPQQGEPESEKGQAALARLPQYPFVRQ